VDKKELNKIIREHKKWLMSEGGERADLSFANLSSANLSSANLSSADLSFADLRFANLSSANLSFANLSSANLSFANLSFANLRGTILENINWLSYIGIVPDKKGFAYAYKVTKESGAGIYYGGINYADKATFQVAEIDTSVNEQCSKGINLATFSWCLNNFMDKSYRLFMFRFNVKDAVCPIGSNGKFRVKKCTKVGECSWEGNLKG